MAFSDEVLPHVHLSLAGWATSGASRESNHEDDDSDCDPRLPVVTLSAFDKTGQEESTIPVPEQQFFTGRVLPSAVANTLCRDLSVNEMFEELNVRDCTLGSLRYSAWEYFIVENCDLGTAYAHLRYQPHDIGIHKRVTKARKYDAKMRRELLEKREIGDHAPPRRLWDLHANRVVPWWVTSKRAWAISHAWVADDDLKYEMTPINGYEWPVPMPKDADLDRIRIEMMNLGAEYVWLDVLCLRQASRGEDPQGHIGKRKWRRREAVRKEEWKVDLPMIGWVYQNVRQVACYLSGLGLPLSFKTDRDFDDERCWFNRAWTLQETPGSVVIAGKTCDDYGIDNRFMTKEIKMRLEAELKHLRHIQQRTKREEQILHILEEMKKRKSSKPVDKITGLVYLFHSKHIPIYDADQHEEDAWTDLLNVADGQLRLALLFLFPNPNRNKSWRPSWRQVMTETFLDLRDDFRSLYGDPNVHWMDIDGDSYDGPRMDACHVQGLADESQNRRCGELKVKDSSGEEHTFRIFANHACPIPDGMYTLLGALGKREWEMFWVVGNVAEPGGEFRKVSVVRTFDNSKEKSIENFDIYRSTETFLF